MKPATAANLAGLARQSWRELDERIAAWRTGAGAGVRLWCGPGCGSCCTLAVNVTLPETLAIAATLTAGQRASLAAAATRAIAHARLSCDARTFLSGYRRAVGACPFLDAGSNCTIYANRPLACRALLSTRPADWCGVNLAEQSEFEREIFLGSLDRSVVAFPTHYAAVPQSFAAALERALLTAMRHATGFALAGSLPLLVWLCGEAGFATALAGGLDPLQDFLAALDAEHPCLVQFETA